MTVKQLEDYLKNFRSTDEVCVSMWDSQGMHYFTPNTPCCKPVTFKAGEAGDVAIIGHFDYCPGHQATRPD